MAGFIDAQREATGDTETSAREPAREFARGGQATGRRIAAADHGQLRLRQRGHVAEHVQGRGRIGGSAQQRGVGRIGGREQCALCVVQPAQVGFDARLVRPRQQPDRPGS
jgi:hypothetical protein